jgi:hypothetical protein
VKHENKFQSSKWATLDDKPTSKWDAGARVNATVDNDDDDDIDGMYVHLNNFIVF